MMFYSPLSALIGRPKIDRAQLPAASTPEGDADATRRASDKVIRRARAAAVSSRRDAILSGGGAPTVQRKTLLGSTG